jgi:colicin import membrane protein
MQRDYDDDLSAFNLKQSQYEAQIDKLIKQAKNKSLSDRERNDLIKQATKLQDEQIKALKQNQREETAILVERAKAAGATAKQILAIQSGAKVSSLNNIKDGADKELIALQENYQKRVDALGTLEVKKEKINNASALLDEERKGREEKTAADKLKADEDLKKKQEAEGKDRAERAKEFDEKEKKAAEYKRATQASLSEANRERIAAENADLQAIKDDQLLKDEERFAAIDELNKKGILSDKEAADAKIKIAQEENAAKVALLIASAFLFSSLRFIVCLAFARIACDCVTHVIHASYLHNFIHA